MVDGEGSDFTEANLDLAVRWTDGPGDLEGLQLGPAERVTVGSGDWIAWPGDPNPCGGEDEKPPVSVSDAGEALAAAAAGLGRARVPALLADSWIEQGRIEPGRQVALDPVRRRLHPSGIAARDAPNKCALAGERSISWVCCGAPHPLRVATHR